MVSTLDFDRQEKRSVPSRAPAATNERGFGHRVPPSFPDRSVCVVGLGYVGLTLAVVMAEVGFDVMGTDIQEPLVRRISSGDPPFWERGLAHRLRQVLARESLRVGRDIVGRPRVYIITVGTPLDEQRRVRTDMIIRAAGDVASRLEDGDLVVLRSTVKVGTSRQVVKPILEQARKSFGLAYCPERTLEGNALEELRVLPQIIGALTPDDTARASQIFQYLTPTTIRVSELETAELIKLVDNSQRDVRFAYSNEVAGIADAIGVSAMEVIQAGRLGYPRAHLASPGPVGGPCLEKDPYILAESLEDYRFQPELTLAARRVNERQPKESADYLGQIIREHGGFPQSAVISLLGVAFKGRPATDDLRGTVARPVLAELARTFPLASFRGWDAVVREQDLARLGLTPVGTVEQAFDGANLVLILNDHECFSQMGIETLARRLARPAIVYDFWNHFTMDALVMPKGTSYVALGSHHRLSLSPLPLTR